MIVPESPLESMDGSLTSVISSRTEGGIVSRQVSISRQVGKENVASIPPDLRTSEDLEREPIPDVTSEVEEIMKSKSFVSLERMVKKVKEVYDFRRQRIEFEQPTTSKALQSRSESELNLSAEMKRVLREKKLKSKKSNLKTIGVQTEQGQKHRRAVRLKIKDQEENSQQETETESDTTPEFKDEVDKETQTGPKEKQD